MNISTTRMRVGVDLLSVDQVAASVERFGDRYLNRIFTAHEQACCPGSPTVAAAGLAARFAAKEATIKVLRPSAATPAWTSIEVHRHPDGWCELRLSGEAAELAEAAHLADLSVSISHETTGAIAFVVATETVVES